MQNILIVTSYVLLCNYIFNNHLKYYRSIIQGWKFNIKNRCHHNSPKNIVHTWIFFQLSVFPSALHRSCLLKGELKTLKWAVVKVISQQLFLKALSKDFSKINNWHDLPNKLWSWFQKFIRIMRHCYQFLYTHIWLKTVIN